MIYRESSPLNQELSHAHGTTFCLELFFPKLLVVVQWDWEVEEVFFGQLFSEDVGVTKINQLMFIDFLIPSDGYKYWLHFLKGAGGKKTFN